MKKNFKRIVSVSLILILASTALFAADDFGFNEYLGKIKNFLMAIGGGLLIISLFFWALKAIVIKNITTADKTALMIMGIGGITLIIGPTVISNIFNALGGTNI